MREQGPLTHLTPTVANWWGNYYHGMSPSQVNFLLFNAIWTFLALAYLIVVPWRFSETIAHHKFAILGVEAVTMLFWFAGFIALAVFLSGRLCYGRVCDCAKAAAVFAAFEWLVQHTWVPWVEYSRADLDDFLGCCSRRPLPWRSCMFSAQRTDRRTTTKLRRI